ncbi:unnamed protein product [Callosobruchus maculatus]|uniref:Yippee domain-containing protein n=1 Tax=Callosobruchus maculatus TaxID=64391 RepID=A0A653DU43_CALMS|nr:unnamed protein product [Callosobruchus maculatus]
MISKVVLVLASCGNVCNGCDSSAWPAVVPSAPAGAAAAGADIGGSVSSRSSSRGNSPELGGGGVRGSNRTTTTNGGTMVKTFQAYLPPQCHRTYSCIHCRAHLANHDELISKSFQGSQGRAYLFNSVVNVGCGPAEERVLLTGLHAVADIYCECCKTTLGWKYEHAFESSQKYKEGKFIIELAHMIKENGWD